MSGVKKGLFLLLFLSVVTVKSLYSDSRSHFSYHSLKTTYPLVLVLCAAPWIFVISDSSVSQCPTLQSYFFGFASLWRLKGGTFLVFIPMGRLGRIAYFLSLCGIRIRKARSRCKSNGITLKRGLVFSGLLLYGREKGTYFLVLRSIGGLNSRLGGLILCFFDGLI